MSGTIFNKLLITHLLIMFVVICVSAAIFSEIYSSRVFREKYQSLDNAAFKVNLLANGYAEGSVSREELESSMDSLGYVTDSKIYLVKLSKDTLSGNLAQKLGEDFKDGFLVNDLKNILDGRTVRHHDQYSQAFGMYIVFTGEPWKDGDKINGAILLFSPINELAGEIARINLTIGLISGILILLSSVVIYFNSLRISRPIKRIEQAALKLAAGEKTGDIEVVGKDEVASLTRSFNAMKRQLENTEKMRREFIANVSHDLRTPLTSIIGLSRGILDGIVKPEDSVKYARIINEEANRLERLTNDILRLAKLQSGSIKLNKENLSAAEVLRTVTETVRSLLEEKSMTLETECSENQQVFADRDRLIEIMMNIIGNSVKYGKERGRISISVGDRAGSTRISVKDDGIGISSDELPFIFEKFYRVDKSRQASQNSTGLGLNIVKNLVELHGGRIWAESEPGVGTEIIFELPGP